MMLATTKVEDFDRFLKVFSTKGAEKRKQHGSKGATVFRDPTEADRVWVIFDWDTEGFKSFLSDDDVVVHGNPERLGHVDDRLRHLDVGARRRRIAGGMVVHQHDRGRR